MNNETRRGIAATFREAKKHLWGGHGEYFKQSKTKFICHAIERVYFRCAGDYRQQAKQIVRERLGGAVTVGEWLRNVANIPSEEYTYENAQAYRHRWLDALIKEFES